MLYMFTTRSELRKVLFLALSVTFLFVYEYLSNRWTDLRQIHTEDMHRYQQQITR